MVVEKGHLFKWVEEAVYEEVEDALPKIGMIANEIVKAKCEVVELKAMMQELKEELMLSKLQTSKGKVSLRVCFVWLCFITIVIVYIMVSKAKENKLVFGY